MQASGQFQLYVNLHIFEDIIVEHFIVQKFFLGGLGHRF